MNCGNIEERQFIHLGGFGGWAGHRLLLRGVELILKGPVRIVPGDEDGAEEGCPSSIDTGKGTAVLGSVDLWGPSRYAGHVIQGTCHKWPTRTPRKRVRQYKGA